MDQIMAATSIRIKCFSFALMDVIYPSKMCLILFGFGIPVAILTICGSRNLTIKEQMLNSFNIIVETTFVAALPLEF
jgi:hypothetical protein